MVATAGIGLLVVAACDAGGSVPHNPAAYVEGDAYAPAFEAANFDDPQPNPWFPLDPGTRTVFESADERVEVTVTDQTREIAGVTATVVTDQVFVDGELAEDTIDWYATDNAGNVWYLGEQTAEYENGKVTTTAGSWEAGVDGAQPGIAMLADPQVDDVYRQEYDSGNAEDVGQVVALGESVSVPAGAYDDVVVTEDWTPLEPDVRERKWYAPGVGVVYEETIAGGSGTLSLVEITTGP
jgi:hypothetical protein